MKKLSLVALLSVLTVGALVGCGNTSSSETPAPSSSETPVSSEAPSSSEVVETNELPAAWDEGETYQALECSVSLVPGSLSNKDDATINNSAAKPVKDFLNHEGIRFIDLRDVKEGYGVGHIQGFESISYFNTIVGDGEQLFQKTDAGFVARYEESEFVLNDMFPKDATLFVMCQVGGRVQPFLTLLDQYDYDMSKVYNVGGWNQIKDLKDFGGYEVSLGIGASEITYDFSSLTKVGGEAKAARRAADVPAAWDEGETYQALECSVSLVPGSLSNKDDATINNSAAKPVKDYLTTEKIRFYDLRDVKEGYGVGHIQKFESVSYFNTIVGDGAQLFQKTDAGFVARYEESEAIINDIFPKDAKLFVMCQVGGRVQPFLTLLDQLGYDMANVYNVGGWNQIKDLKDFGGYEVSLGIGASAVTYDFSALTPVTAA